MPEMEIRVRYTSKDGAPTTLTFRFLVHEVKAPEGLMLESDFYRKLPHGTHYEVEITGPEAVLSRSGLHIHVSKREGQHKGKKFACWPQQISSMAEAIEIVQVWCVGTLYTMISEKDFGPLYDGCKADSEKFLSLLKEKGFSLVEEI